MDVEEDGRDACLGDTSERLDSPRCAFFLDFYDLLDEHSTRSLSFYSCILLLFNILFADHCT